MVNSSVWPFADSPWDLLVDCQAAATDESRQFRCTMSTILGVISIYVFPVFGTFGLISNVHIFLVFAWLIKNRTRQMVYLAFVACADFLNILTIGWLWMVPAKGIPYATQGRYYFFTVNAGSMACTLHRSINTFASCLSTTAFLLLCLDRCMTMFFPFKARKYGVKSAWLACGVVFVIALILTSPYAVYYSYTVLDTGITVCTLSVKNDFWPIYNMIFHKVGMFQSASIFITNIVLVIKLRLIMRTRNTLTNDTQESRGVSRQEMEATILIIILSVLFLICSVPLAVGYFLSYIAKKGEGDPMLLRFLWNFGDLMYHLYFLQESINWLIYVWRMPEFRAKAVPCCARDKGKSVYSEQMLSNNVVQMEQ